MRPSKYRPALNAYCKLLDEAKYRLAALDILLGGKTRLPAGAIHECSYLQLRMLCELIALGSLIAQGDHEPTSKIKKAYEAGKIIKYLEKLHPEFYPRAARQTKSGPDAYDAVLLEDGVLTKKELVQLYTKCGQVLHRGTLRVLFSNQNYDRDHTEIQAWKAKIETLLRYHMISMLDKKTFVLFVLRNKENNDQVQCVVLESDELMSILSSGKS